MNYNDFFNMLLEIPAEMESVLSAKAELHGLALSEYLFSLFEADVDDYYSLSVEEIASVKQGLAELAAGDEGMLLEDYWTEFQAKREAHTAEHVLGKAA